MSRRINTPRGRTGRRSELIWVFAAVVVIAALLYWEQAAVVYVLSILAVSAFLLVVAFSDLDRGKAESDASTVGKNEALADVVEAAPVSPTNTPRRLAKPKRRGAAGGRLTG